MDLPSLESMISIGAGVGGGSLTVGWIAKMLISRFIQENDRKHNYAAKAIKALADSHEKAYDKIASNLSTMNTDIAVIKARIGEVMAVQEEVKQNGRDVAIALERIGSNSDDIDAGFSSMREQLATTRQELSDIKRLKPL